MQVWPNSARYEGEWKDGKAHGEGEYRNAKGDHYIGEFLNDLRHGEGEEKLADGSRY